jgi:hypothetical protein
MIKFCLFYYDQNGGLIKLTSENFVFSIPLEIFPPTKVVLALESLILAFKGARAHDFGLVHSGIKTFHVRFAHFLLVKKNKNIATLSFSKGGRSVPW